MEVHVFGSTDPRCNACVLIGMRACRSHCAWTVYANQQVSSRREFSERASAEYYFYNTTPLLVDAVVENIGFQDSLNLPQ